MTDLLIGSSVAVVGAGISGLTAAFRLQQAGYAPVVFEAEQHPGGRTVSTMHDGYIVDRGAGILSSQYTHLLGLLDDARLSHLVVPANGVFGFARDDGGVTELDGSHMLRDAMRFPLSLRSKLVATRLLTDVLRHRRRLLALDLTLAGELDRESAAEYAGRRLTAELLRAVVDPVVRGLAGTAADDASVFDFLVALSKFLGSRALAGRDGMGSFAEQLSRLMTVEYGTRVTAVRYDGDVAEVSWTDDRGRSHADRLAGCVIALPATAVTPLHRGLDQWRADFLASIRYTICASGRKACARLVWCSPRRSKPGSSPWSSST